MAVIIGLKVSCTSEKHPGLDDPGTDTLLISVKYPEMSKIAYLVVQLVGKKPPEIGDTTGVIMQQIQKAIDAQTGPGGGIPSGRKGGMVAEVDGGKQHEAWGRLVIYGADEVNIACTTGKLELIPFQPTGPGATAKLKSPPATTPTEPNDPFDKPKDDKLAPKRPPVITPRDDVTSPVNRTGWDTTFGGSLPTDAGKGRWPHPGWDYDPESSHVDPVPLTEKLGAPHDRWRRLSYRTTPSASPPIGEVVMQTLSLQPGGGTAGGIRALGVPDLFTVPFVFKAESPAAQTLEIVTRLRAAGVAVHTDGDAFLPLYAQGNPSLPITAFGIRTLPSLLRSAAFPWEIVFESAGVPARSRFLGHRPRQL